MTAPAQTRNPELQACVAEPIPELTASDYADLLDAVQTVVPLDPATDPLLAELAAA